MGGGETGKKGIDLRTGKEGLRMRNGGQAL